MPRPTARVSVLVPLALVSILLAAPACKGTDHETETAPSGGSAPGDAPTVDVSYDPSAPDDELRSLDVYPLTPMSSAAPVVIWVHGGAWYTGDKANKMPRKVELFNGEGYVLVSLNYRLSPEPKASPDPGRLRFPTHPEDVARGIAWVHEHAESYGGDPDRIALLGHSAGAHLVALIGTAPSFLAPYDLAPSDLRCVGSFDTEGYDIPSAIESGSTQQTTILFNAFGEDPAIWNEASPLTHVGPDLPSFLLVARGTAERRTGVETFRAALEDAGIDTGVIEAGDLDHEGVSAQIGEPDDDIMTPPIRSFLKDCFE
jgi:arylformamidase